MSPQRRARRSEGALGFARAGLLALAVLAPLPFGAVHPWAYSILGVIALGLLSLLLASPAAARRMRSLPLAALACLLVLALVGVLQLVPMPASVASVLAPARLEAARALDPGQATRGTVAEEPLARTLAARSSVPWSFAPDETREHVAKLVLMSAVLAIAALTLRGRRSRRQLAFALAFAGTLVSLLGFARAADAKALFGRWLWAYPHPYGTYINRNHYAGLVELCLPLALALAASSWLSLRRNPAAALAGVVLGSLSAVILSLGLLDAGSRGGLAGAALGVLTLLALLRLHGGARRALLPVGGAGLLAVGVLLFAAERPLGAVRAIDLEEASVQDRLLVWRGTLTLLARHPVLGVGYGAFEEVFAPLRPATSPFRFEHPENDYLQLAAEGGLLAVLPAVLLLGLVLGSIARGIRRMPRRRDEESDPTAWILWSGAVAGVLALLVHGFVDVNLHVPANALLFAILCAVVLSPPSEAGDGDDAGSEPAAHPPRGAGLAVNRAARLVLPAALLLGAAHLARVAAADLVSHGGLPAAVITPADEDPDRAARAARLDPGRASHHFKLGRLQEKTALAGPDAAAASLAFRHLGAAAWIRPLDASAVFELGWTAAMWSGAPGSEEIPLSAYGERLMRRALVLDPARADLRARLGAGLALGRLSRLQEGLEILRQAFTADPGLQDELLWLVESRLPGALVSRAVPDLPENRLRYAARLESRGEAEAAVAQYERALGLSRGLADQEELTRRVAERLARLRPERGAELWGGLAERPGAEVRDLQGLADAQTALGRHAEAQATLARALALRPSPEFRLRIAWAAYRAGDWTVASESAAAVLAAQGSNVDALLVHALCQARLGNAGSATSALERALRLDPKRDDARALLEDLKRQTAQALGAADVPPAP